MHTLRFTLLAAVLSSTVTARTVTIRHDGCADEFVPVARARLAIFLDPTEEKRQRLTKQVVDEFVVPRRTCEQRKGEPAQEPNGQVSDPGPVGGGCFQEGLMNFWRSGDADQEILGPAILESMELYVGCGVTWNPSQAEEIEAPTYPASKTKRGIARRKELLKRAREACTTEKPFKDCQPLLGQLVWNFDPAAWSGIARLDAESREAGTYARWMKLHEGNKDRGKFLAAALKEDYGDGWTAGAFVARAAIEEIIGERDPRLWSPEDLAVLVWSSRHLHDEARRLHDEARQLFPMSRVRTSVNLRPDWTDGMPSRLGRRIGFRRTWDLLYPERGGPPELARNGRLFRDLQGVERSHFDGEDLLYRFEWRALPLDPATVNLPEDKQVRGGETYFTYAVRRWHETDDAAPHPDLDRVKKLVEKFERAGGP